MGFEEVKLPPLAAAKERAKPQLGNLNQLQSLRWMGLAMNKHYEWLRTAKKRGDKVAWHIADMGSILEDAMGIPTLMQANYTAIVSTAKQHKPFYDAAIEDGHMTETCCYIKVLLGRLHMHEMGIATPPGLDVPPPDFVVCCVQCTEQAQMAWLMQRKLGIPIAVIDLSLVGCETEDDFKQRAKYVERQLREEVVPLIEKMAGRKYDYDKLSEMIAELKKTALMRDEMIELLKNKPAPMTLFDLAIALGGLITLLGRPEVTEWYAQLKAEAEQRVKDGVGAVPGEKYRFYWDGFTMWSLLGTVMRKLVEHGATLIAGRYPFHFSNRADLLDPNDPLRSLSLVHTIGSRGSGYPEWTNPFIADCVEKFDLDGLLMPSNPAGCRLFNLGQEDMIMDIERKYGIPGITFPADMVDPTVFSPAQFETKFEALLETIDARRARRA